MKANTHVAPIMERPVRAPKPVERLITVMGQDPVKRFRIEQGRGTPLHDIPNVTYKLSKKEATDDTLKLLHTVLFGRRAKAFKIKNNILSFSGFVWKENEEKQKTKMHKKLNKFYKEKLIEFCDLLDVPITSTTSKKKDIIANLIDFLLVPHATTDVLLAENEQSRQGHKRARVNMMYESNYWATPSTNSSKFKRVLQSSKGNKRARVNMMYATYTSSTDSSEISYSSSEATYDTDEEEEDDQNVTVSESEEEESTFESSKDNP